MQYFSQEITRRTAMQRIFGAITAVGASSFLTFEDLLAADAATIKPLNVVWIHGTSCTGCSCSLLDVETVPVVDILTKFTNMIFHHDISLATGSQVTDIYEKLIHSDSSIPYVIVFEGGIPIGMPHTCMVGHRTMEDWMKQLLPKAAACIAAGTCASFGGVTEMLGTETGNASVLRFAHQNGITTPIVLLPGCPMKPEHFVYTLLYHLHHKKLPDLDRYGRPRRFFSRTVHELCINYADFQEGHFAQHIGDQGCLIKMGCQGMVTRSDCLITGYNNNTNVCIRAGHPCVGCAGENFPRRFMFHNYDDTRDIIPRRP
ncbi:hydrogenase small subunit [Chrysiogenes arsenatis]|uniref:hydrogenase small subunit n=1 Tax=Chrysiogenes arsenatis TaxID=309797 RepID=UPI0004040A03|nr:hydrogenase small subunit [Chrysiogenes arsenatis]